MSDPIDHHRPTTGPLPPLSGEGGIRYLIRGAAAITQDPALGEMPRADILIEGRRIVAIAPELSVEGVPVVDAAGMIAVPGFVDTHHHLFETALRGFLPDGLLTPDSTRPPALNAVSLNYMEHVLGKLAPVYRPEDVEISTEFGALSQLDSGVTSILDVSQIHHSMEHSEASIQALCNSGGRNVFGYFESSGDREGNSYPEGAYDIARQYFASREQNLTMVVGGEIYRPGHERSWQIARDLGMGIVSHIVGPMGMGELMSALVEKDAIGADNLFLHMTDMPADVWRRIADVGAGVSLAVGIEMLMGHGTPPVVAATRYGVEPSLSSDVETTFTADWFTQMRMAMAAQRGAVNQLRLDDPADETPLLTARDALRWGTLNGARQLRLDDKVGTLAPGKEADLVLLDGRALNVTPVNDLAGAVVSLMDRSNVDTVIVAGRIRKWQGRLLGVDMETKRARLEASRDHLFRAAGMEHVVLT